MFPMPGFTKKGDTYFCSYITGPSHVLLGLRLGSPSVIPSMVRLPAKQNCQHGALDEDRIREAVQQGLAQVFARLGVELHVAEISYVADDSPRYEMYQHCAMLLAER